MRCLAALLVTLVAFPLAADCIANGHYTIVTTVNPVSGSSYPYTEDITSRPDVLPIPDPMFLGYHDDLRWVKIQSGCTSFREENIHASAPVNLLLRAAFTISYPTSKLAVTGTRYEVQLRLGKTSSDRSARVVLDEVRRFDGRYPVAQRFGATVQDLPAGDYVYSLWFRLLDGPVTNAVQLGLQWLNAQGVPHALPSERVESDEDAIVGTEWTPLSRTLELTARRTIDLALQSSFSVEEASDNDARLELAYDLDELGPGTDRFSTAALPLYRPASMAIFDHRAQVERGGHTLRLWARATKGTVRLRKAILEYVSFPSRVPDSAIIPMQDAYADEPVEVKAAGDAEQPRAMSPICGRWSKILEFPTDSSSGTFSWSLEGYIEFLGADISGYGQLAIEVTREEPSRDDPTRLVTVASDVGMHEFQIVPTGDGVWFFGDLSNWGNAGGSTISLWVRRFEGCNSAPFGGGFTVGRRWLSVKMLPSGLHLP